NRSGSASRFHLRGLTSLISLSPRLNGRATFRPLTAEPVPFDEGGFVRVGWELNFPAVTPRQVLPELRRFHGRRGVPTSRLPLQPASQASDSPNTRSGPRWHSSGGCAVSE